MTFTEISRCLSPEDQKIVTDILLYYEDIDRQTLKFASQTGLSCQSGCGACCENPDIETTVTEVLPLAVDLWSRGQAQGILESIQLMRADTRAAPTHKTSGICVFYRPHHAAGAGGRCSIYAYRPGLCRLFGFCVRRDKQGAPQLITCKIIKESQSQAYTRTQQQLHQGLPAPLLSDHALRVFNIDAAYGQKLLSINQAIALALEKVGFCMAHKEEKLEQ